MLSLSNNPEELRRIIKELNSQLQNNLILLKKKNSEISDLKFKVNLLNKAVFGKKFEKWNKVEMGQSLLFNEIETNLYEDGSTSFEANDKFSTSIFSEPLLFSESQAYILNQALLVSIPESFPREEKIHNIPEFDRICKCGYEMESFGEEIIEKVDIRPSQIIVIKHIRPKYICKRCSGLDSDENLEVKIAPAIPEFLPNTIADTGFLAYIFVAKFCDGIPFYRICNMLSRHEFKLSRATLCIYAIASYAKLKPLDDELWSLIFQSPVIQINESPIKVLSAPNQEKEYKDSKSSLLVLRAEIGGKPIIRFVHNQNEESKLLLEKLKGYKGILQTKDLNSEDKLNTLADFSHGAGCWVHTQREFIRILDSDKFHQGAEQFVSLITELYKIEERMSSLQLESIKNIRNSESRKIINRIQNLLADQIIKTLPNSQYGKALANLKKQWSRLILFLEYPELKLDTSFVENAIRPFVIGRKNWVFSNIIHGANASAFLYSLIETAKMNNLDPTEYLRTLMDQVTLGKKPNLLEFGSPKNQKAFYPI